MTATNIRTVVASAQGEVIHIKCKQTGRVILKLKVLNHRSIAAAYSGGCHEVLIDMCNSHGTTGYDCSDKAAQKIAAYERGELPK